MQLTIVRAKPSDAQKWNDFVQAQADSTPYHFFAWGEAVSKSYGHTLQYYMALNNDRDIVAILPAIEMRSINFKKIICALPYCDTAACLAVSDELKTIFLKKVLSEHLSNFPFDYRDQDITAAYDEDKLLGRKVRMLMTLKASAEEQLASFKSKLRSQIKKALKNGLSIKNASGTALLADFYSVYSRNMRDLGSPVHSQKWFKYILEEYEQYARVFIVYHDNVAIGGSIVISQGKVNSVPWASTLKESNYLAPNMLLYWGMLEQACNAGANTFDFGRSTFGEGTYRFKKQWGALPVLLHWRKFTDGSEEVQTDELTQAGASKLRSLVERVWQKMPLPLTNFIGAQFRGYISL